jgi:hypothetical protein
VPPPPPLLVVDPRDVAAVDAQLGRPARSVLAVAHRCGCGLPDVITTAPRLADGTPFPTRFYLTCPRACSAVGRLEAGGVMARYTSRLASEPALAKAYQQAARDYLARRDVDGRLPGDPLPGGMPDRVKCLHVALAHSLAAGPGVNPVGDETLAALPAWDGRGRCVGVDG